MATAIEIKEKPILFSSEMVRAILEGRKTQTRRVLKHPEYYGDLTGDCPHWDKRECAEAIHKLVTPECPYGQPGDRLWVRETLRRDPHANVWHYEAGKPEDWVVVKPEHYTASLVWAHHKDGDICPSIFMPRWASRITLEITQVRVERLQEISTFDCLAEGIARDFSRTKFPDFDDAMAECKYYIGKYRELWDKINGKKHPWQSNPWVWAISFKRGVTRRQR